MIYLFAGEDIYGSFLKAKEKAENLSNNIGYKTINAESLLDYNELVQELEGISMFSDQKILLIKRLLSNKKIFEAFFSNIEYLNKYSIVLWEEGKVDLRLKFIKFLQENKQLFIFNNPSESEIKLWIKTMAKNIGLNLDFKIIDFLFLRLEFNKYAIEQELFKFKNYLFYKNISTLSILDVEKLMGYNLKGDTWKFLDFFSSKNIAKALHEYKKLISFEDSTQQLISLINREIRLMHMYKLSKLEGSNTLDLKLHPFVLKKVALNSKNFSIEELERIQKNLLDLDYKIKSGKVNEESAFVFFLTSV